MSVSISDLMKLPSFKEAKVVAGHAGMNKIVTSISVLELDDPEVLGLDAYGHTRYYGSEILITAFMSSRFDVEHQCETVRRLKDEGEIGIIIFYVGCIIPKLNQKLIDLANMIEMPLIVMPEGRIELRYSDVICDVMEAIFKDRNENSYFAAGLIEEISHKEGAQRSLNTVLSLIRNRTHCSIFLLDEADELLNFIEWPNDRNLPIKSILPVINSLNCFDEIIQVTVDNRIYYLDRSRIIGDTSNLEVVIIKELDDLSLDCCNQTIFVIKTYLNLWTNNYGKLNTKQLINALIHDEPDKMHLIAEKLGICISDFSYTYFLFSKDFEDHDYSKLKLAKQIVKDFVSVYDNDFIIDIFDETIVILAQKGRETLSNELDKLLAELYDADLNYYAEFIDTINTTKEAKECYWLLQQCKRDIPVIFPHKSILTGGELSFLQRCKDSFMPSTFESFIQKKIREQVLIEKNQIILIDTLETFLLDGDRNISKTAELMYIHINTAKYRIKNLEQIFGHKLTRMPEVYDLYLDAAYSRLNRVRTL